MSERNKRKEILRSFNPFVRNLAKLGVDNFNKNSEAIGTLNALVEKCKTYSEHIYQDPPGNYCINSDISFDADFDDNFDVNKILPLIENIWDEYNEKLSHIMVYKMFTVLKLSLLSKSAESITTEQIRRIFRLGENVLKSKIKFINDQIKTVCSVSDVFSALMCMIENGDFKDLDVPGIFSMLCDISFDFVDAINDIMTIDRKNYFAPWVLASFVTTSFNSWCHKKDKYRKTDMKNNVTRYVWERAKKTLNNGITEKNIGIAGGMFFVLKTLLGEMLEDKNIVDKDIANVSIINDDFQEVLKLVANVLKSEYSGEQPLNVAMEILWNIKLSKITKKQNEQVDEILKSLGLKFENGEIVIKDKNIFDKLPKNSAIKSAIQMAQDYAIYRYTEEVRNGSKNTNMNKTDDEKESSQGDETQNANEVKNENERDNKNYKGNIGAEQPNNFQTEEKKGEDEELYNINPEIKDDDQKIIKANTQSKETDKKRTYTNEQILEEIENAYCQNREIDNNISPDGLCSAIKSSSKRYYHIAMLSSKKYKEIRENLSLGQRIVIFFCRLLFKWFYLPEKNNTYKQLDSTKNWTENPSLYPNTISKFPIRNTTQGYGSKTNLDRNNIKRYD